MKVYVNMYKQNQNNEENVSAMPNLQTNCCSKLDFQKAKSHTGGKWLIQGNIHD